MRTKFVCERHLADTSLGAYEEGCRVVEVELVAVVEPGKDNALRGHVALVRERREPKDALGRLALIVDKLAEGPAKMELQECANDLASLFCAMENRYKEFHDDHMALVKVMARMRKSRRRRAKKT